MTIRLKKMAYRTMNRSARLLAATLILWGLAGCSGKGIQFTNVSDTWLNVRYFVGPKAEEPDGTTEMYWRRTQQVKPGETSRITAPRNLVHMQVETVTPSWKQASRSYWLELLTTPPVHIVATGRGDKLDFKTGSGEVAIIPERELTGGRYEYRRQPPPPPPKAGPAPPPEPDSTAPPQELVGPASSG